MNITQGYIFVTAKADGRINGVHHDIIIVWERADIDDMMDDLKYVFVGTCQYDTENKMIVKYER